jgi:hypothetical protein
LLPAHCAIPEYNRRHLAQPCRIFGDELGVLLILRGKLPGMPQRFPGKGAEITIFAYLRVVNESLAPNPAQQGLRLTFIGVTAESEAILHSVIVPQKYLGRKYERH